jgi:hypothetical protein
MTMGVLAFEAAKPTYPLIDWANFVENRRL